MGNTVTLTPIDPRALAPISSAPASPSSSSREEQPADHVLYHYWDTQVPGDIRSAMVEKYGEWARWNPDLNIQKYGAVVDFDALYRVLMNEPKLATEPCLGGGSTRKTSDGTRRALITAIINAWLHSGFVVMSRTGHFVYARPKPFDSKNC